MTLKRAKLSAAVYDMSAGTESSAPRTAFLVAVECLPAGGARCGTDAAGNVGAANSGELNFGGWAPPTLGS